MDLVPEDRSKDFVNENKVELPDLCKSSTDDFNDDKDHANYILKHSKPTVFIGKGYERKEKGQVKSELKHDEKTFTCNQCEYQAVKPSRLSRHQQSKHGSVKHSCDKCDYKATRLDNLKIHNIDHLHINVTSVNIYQVQNIIL